MAIKIAIAFEVEGEPHAKDVLQGMQRMLLALKLAPKYKVKITRECENLEIGDGFPLDLAALGVGNPPDTPMERYITALTDADLGQHLTSVSGVQVEVSTNSLER